MQVVVYTLPTGGCAVAVPIPPVTAETFTPPAGAVSIIVDSASLPSTPQEEWGISGGVLVTTVAAPAYLAGYASASWNSILAAGRIFNVAASGAAVSVLCDGTNSTRADLALLALFGQANPTGTKTWIDNNGVSTVLTGAQFVTLATLAGNWVSDTYPALQTLLGEINATPPTITTTAQIDAYAWPAS